MPTFEQYEREADAIDEHWAKEKRSLKRLRHICESCDNNKKAIKQFPVGNTYMWLCEDCYRAYKAEGLIGGIDNA